MTDRVGRAMTRCRWPSVDPDRRYVEGEVDGVADEHAARLEHAIPDEPVVRTVELTAQCQREPVSVLVVRNASAELTVEQDRTRDALDRQLARQREVATVAVEMHRDGVEADLGEVLDVEEIRRAQVRVALVVQRLEAHYLDRAGDGRIVSGDDRSFEVAEPSVDGLDHHVLDAELDCRMRRVDRPRPARQQLLPRALDYRHLAAPFGWLTRAPAALAGLTPASRLDRTRSPPDRPLSLSSHAEPEGFAGRGDLGLNGVVENAVTRS